MTVALAETATTPAPPHTTPVGRAARVADALIVVYQRLTAGRPSPCRYWPTCSNYAREALAVHGFWRGAALTTRRLGRCRPLAPSGYDPVPDPGAAPES